MRIESFTPLREAKILEEADGRHRVAIQIIRPGTSANGRIYESKMLAEASPLYEGAKVFMDHPTKSDAAQRPERSVRDLVGYLESVKPDMSAELVIVKHADEIVPLIRESIESGQDLIGMSHNALADVRVVTQGGKRREKVEAIRAVKAVDIVTEAAAGGKFKRILEGGNNMDFENVKELQEAYPELMESFKGEVVNELREGLREEIEGKVYGGKEKITEAQRKMEGQFKSLSESITKLTEENTKLTDALEAKERDGIITAKLSESKLPEIASARVRELVEAKTYESNEKLIEAVDAAVKSEKEYLSKVTEAGKVTGLGSGKDAGGTEAAAITEARKHLEEALGVLDKEKEGDK
jgi:hypothetical protein